MGDWGQDGWAVRPGQGRRVDLGGPHWLEVLVRGAQVGEPLGAELNARFHTVGLPGAEGLPWRQLRAVD
jgi:hypothetical protein